jgi:hypothetical protein
MVLAGHRGDQTGYQTLRPPTGHDDEFLPTAFATIQLLAAEVAESSHENVADVLGHVQQEGGSSMLGPVAEMALEPGNTKRFNELGERHGADPDFVPAIFTIVIWLAEELGRATGTTCEAVLEDLAMTATVAEAGMLPDN